MYKNRSRGFTLIELLVVIAIIGILSSVVLASLSTARNKGTDAAIQSNLSAIQSEAEIYYGSTGANSYGGGNLSSCSGTAPATLAGGIWSDATIIKAINAVTKITDAPICGSSKSAYAISAKLLVGVGGKMNWCLDSTGSAMPTTNPITAGDTACPTS